MVKNVSFGDKGEDVKSLQTKLKDLGYLTGGADGIFGQATKLALIKFQKNEGLVADGIAGSRTLSKLEDSNPIKPNKTEKVISQKGINFIQSFEGYSSKAYDDGVGVWTIGWGTTIKPNGQKVKKGDVATKDQSLEYFKHDLKSFELAVNRLVKVNINQDQYDALVSFTYNVGIGALTGSTALRKINQGDLKGGADAMLSWNKGTVNGKKVELKGLTRRRNAERNLFLSISI